MITQNKKITAVSCKTKISFPVAALIITNIITEVSAKPIFNDTDTGIEDENGSFPEIVILIGLLLIFYLMGNEFYKIWFVNGCAPPEAEATDRFEDYHTDSLDYQENIQEEILGIANKIISQIENIDQSKSPEQEQSESILEDLTNLIDNIDLLRDEVKQKVREQIESSPTIQQAFFSATIAMKFDSSQLEILRSVGLISDRWS